MTPPPLTIAVAQPPCAAGDVAANVAAHAAVVRSAGARVIVFPELSLTGYELGAPELRPEDPRLAPLVAACARTGALALAGAPVPAAPGGAGPSIAVLAISAAGVTVAYRKMWLGEAEAARFAPGTRPGVVAAYGWRLGLAVCKDTGVPAHAAATAALGIDAYVAGVLEHAADHAVPARRARRIAAEHGVHVVMASFAGRTGGGYDQAAGGSGIWAPDGTALATAGPEPGAVARARLIGIPAGSPPVPAPAEE
jgi:predicted amidohydrolase